MIYRLILAELASYLVTICLYDKDIHTYLFFYHGREIHSNMLAAT